MDDFFERLESQVTLADVVQIDFIPNEVKLAYQMAKLAMIGGTSRIYEGDDRRRYLEMNQFLGVGIGELAGNKHFFTVKDYYQSRKKKNENPLAGDNGCDTLGYRLDYKASAITRPDILNYNLVVRPKERHEGFAYVLVLVETHGRTPLELATGPLYPVAHLMGWASDDMLEGRQHHRGIFGPTKHDGGAFVIPVRELRKMKDLNVSDWRMCDAGV